ncbi:hypothetical protein AXG93_3459s1020 [Marchantia polymorpha subsp. ruderalis]|uniref:Uncharacterized protein n=1 Tax=Marchantia polymorpha subsp. ruderalis TaxID=1480154 RepID=A0A176W4B8_MARPO|nr:hypothetical protein AXG93_3459s1020 [Marchantia polymorpha subsp. ruderalis]
MAPKKSDRVKKLVPLKVPYEELRPFRRELRELRLEFRLWNWNCVSASICKEVMDKNVNEGEELRGNPMLWTIEHWTKVMGPCAGSDRDLLFEKNIVGLTRGEEFSFGPLFDSGRQGTNGWKTADYRDPKRRAIALGIMHILRPARMTPGTSSGGRGTKTGGTRETNGEAKEFHETHLPRSHVGGPVRLQKLKECYRNIPPQALFVVPGPVPVLAVLAGLEKGAEGNLVFLCHLHTLAIEEKIASFSCAPSQDLLPVFHLPSFRMWTESARRLVPLS